MKLVLCRNIIALYNMLEREAGGGKPSKLIASAVYSCIFTRHANILSIHRIEEFYLLGYEVM
jgi:hypothetical protein